MKDNRENTNKKLTEFLLYKSPNGELQRNATVSILEIVQNENGREVIQKSGMFHFGNNHSTRCC